MSRVYDMRDPATRSRGIAAAVAALRRGELVAMPTETVYGLAADAGNAMAVEGIFLAKARPRFNPLIVHVESRAAAAAIATFSVDAERLAERFWPGPLTLVLPRRPGAAIAKAATAGLDSVAVRVPDDENAQALLAAFSGPLVAPSANRSGRLSATTASAVSEDLGDTVAVILDAGPTAIGVESAIVGFAGGEPLLLRAGGLARAAIEAAIGRELGTPASDPAAPTAPGMLASHYAPAAALRLDVASVEPGEALLAFGPAIPPGAERAAAVVNLSEAGDLEEAAARLFSALRELDRGVKVIAVAPIPREGLGEAINDRLRHAAAPRS